MVRIDSVSYTQLQNKEIELKLIVDGEALSFMDDMDVSALFGNMLDKMCIRDRQRTVRHIRVKKRS